MINVTKTYLPPILKLNERIQRIYESNWVTNRGQLVVELEQRLKEYLGVANIVVVANGTLALQVAYKALGLTGEVITTPFSFPATVSSLVWEGLKPVFADIDPHTFNISCKNVRKKISQQSSAIVSTHVFGNACEIEELQAIASEHGLKLIFDGAHTFGVKYKGQAIQNFGDVTILSFHATKLFHTIEGGAIVTNDERLAQKIRLMINFGIAGPGKVVELGINAKMNEFEAAMGLCVLEDIDWILEERKKVYDYYRAHLTNVTFQQRNPHCTNNYSHAPVLFPSEHRLLKTVDALAVRGIKPRRYFFPSLDTLPYVDTEIHRISVDVAQRILCLPIWHGIEDKSVAEICEVLNTWVLNQE